MPSDRHQAWWRGGTSWGGGEKGEEWGFLSDSEIKLPSLQAVQTVRSAPPCKQAVCPVLHWVLPGLSPQVTMTHGPTKASELAESDRAESLLPEWVSLLAATPCSLSPALPCLPALPCPREGPHPVLAQAQPPGIPASRERGREREKAPSLRHQPMAAPVIPASAKTRG